MKRTLFEASHKLWVEAQLRAPAWAIDTVMPYLHETKEMMRWRPYLTAHQLQGRNQGGPLTVDYVGLDYKPTLVDSLFSEKPNVKKLDRTAVWNLSTVADQSDSDLVVIVAGKHLIHSLPRKNAIVLPFIVRMILDVSGDWQDVRSRIHKGVRGHEFRLLRKYGYEYDISSREEDFEMFYHSMYMPTIKARKGDLASPMSIREASLCFRHGFLHLIKRNDQYVAGILSHRYGNYIMSQLMGVIDADEQLMHEGALGSAYYSAIHWANKEEYAGVILGGCVPRLNNTVFQYKRKWGAAVTYSDKIHKHIWIKIKRNTPAVRRFFRDNPAIIVGKHGQLQGLIMIDNPDVVTSAIRNEWDKKYLTPGLECLNICSMEDIFDETDG